MDRVGGEGRQRTLGQEECTGSWVSTIHFELAIGCVLPMAPCMALTNFLGATTMDLARPPRTTPRPAFESSLMHAL
jgi:hypothetical protein